MKNGSWLSVELFALLTVGACSVSHSPKSEATNEKATKEKAAVERRRRLDGRFSPEILEKIKELKSNFYHLEEEFNLHFEDVSDHGDWDTGILKYAGLQGELESKLRWTRVIYSELRLKRTTFNPKFKVKFGYKYDFLIDVDHNSMTTTLSDLVFDESRMKHLLRNWNLPPTALKVKIEQRIAELKKLGLNVSLDSEMMQDKLIEFTALRVLWVLDSLMAYQKQSPEKLAVLKHLGVIEVSRRSGVSFGKTILGMRWEEDLGGINEFLDQSADRNTAFNNAVKTLNELRARYPKLKWDNRLMISDSVELAECINLLKVELSAPTSPLHKEDEIEISNYFLHWKHRITLSLKDSDRMKTFFENLRKGKE